MENKYRQVQATLAEITLGTSRKVGQLKYSDLEQQIELLRKIMNNFHDLINYAKRNEGVLNNYVLPLLSKTIVPACTDKYIRYRQRILWQFTHGSRDTPKYKQEMAVIKVSLKSLLKFVEKLLGDISWFEGLAFGIPKVKNELYVLINDLTELQSKIPPNFHSSQRLDEKLEPKSSLEKAATDGNLLYPNLVPMHPLQVTTLLPTPNVALELIALLLQFAIDGEEAGEGWAQRLKEKMQADDYLVVGRAEKVIYECRKLIKSLLSPKDQLLQQISVEKSWSEAKSTSEVANMTGPLLNYLERLKEAIKKITVEAASRAWVKDYLQMLIGRIDPLIALIKQQSVHPPAVGSTLAAEVHSSLRPISAYSPFFSRTVFPKGIMSKKVDQEELREQLPFHYFNK